MLGKATENHSIGAVAVRRPNIVYVHSHDTGRYVQPYGHAVETPRIQGLAEQGLLFRQAFSAAPICSASRAALLTGEYSHTGGMMGLAHRGWRLLDYEHHLLHTLADAGYWTGLVGEQHLSVDPAILGYDEVAHLPDTTMEHVAPAAARLLAERAAAPRTTEGDPQPFFLSVGFFETHREFRDAVPGEERYALPPANLPDTPETRADTAALKASARALDRGVGVVLDALDEHGLADDTLVILTTDHGLPFPGAKATLTDRGIGVLLVMRGPVGGGATSLRGGRVVDALVSQIDVFPTVCDLLDVPPPAWLRGRSLLPLLREETTDVNDAIFAEMTFHAAYEPQRAVRTRRFKYIRRFDDEHVGVVLPNVDDGPSKDVLLDGGWAERPIPPEQLYDLLFDPGELVNRVPDPAYAEALEELRERLARWMEETDDPLRHGHVQPPDGALVNARHQRSPREPTYVFEGGAGI